MGAAQHGDLVPQHQARRVKWEILRSTTGRPVR
jgi:hypothetical protein